MGILNRQQDVSVTTGTVEQKLKGMPNRKSPGKQEIWLKNSMGSRIAEQPPAMHGHRKRARLGGNGIMGRTNLVMKEETKGQQLAT